MIKILNDLVSKNDVVAMINAVASSTGNENAQRCLRSLATSVRQMHSYNIVEAGDINIAVDDVEGFEKFLNRNK